MDNKKAKFAKWGGKKMRSWEYEHHKMVKVSQVSHPLIANMKLYINTNNVLKWKLVASMNKIK
jgi:hypothetical protein